MRTHSASGQDARRRGRHSVDGRKRSAPDRNQKVASIFGRGGR